MIENIGVHDIDILLQMIMEAEYPPCITGSDIALGYAIYAMAQRNTPLVILGNPERIQQILCYIQVVEPWYAMRYALFPAIEHYTKDIGLMQADTLRALYTIAYHNPPLIFVPYSQLYSAFPAPILLEKSCIDIYKGMEIRYDELLHRITAFGYSTTSMVYRCTEMAYRGDIIDIYPPDAYCYTAKGRVEALPLRIEVFGDSIEDIRIFHKETQRFIETKESHTFYPIHFGTCMYGEREEYQRAQEQYHIAIQHVQEKGITTAPSYLYQPTEHTLFDWLPQNAFYIRLDAKEFENVEEEIDDILTRYCDVLTQSLAIPIDCNAVRVSHDIAKALESRRCITTSALPVYDNSIVLEERRLQTFYDICTESIAIESPWKALLHTLREWKTRYRQIILVFKTQKNRDAFSKLAREEDIIGHEGYSIDREGILFCVGDIPYGAILSFAQCVLIPETLLYPKYKTRTSAKKTFKGLQEYTTLQEGMYVIHRDYGIGIYRGLHRLALGGSEGDYILVEYANEDKVYIPIYQLGVLQIYTPNNDVVTLDSLGSNAWKNSIAKAKKAIEEVAHDLIAMYAERSCAQKYRYGPYTELYREFEMSFGFEETPDQAQAIEDVLEDMDKAMPMDRLVCGDVGFGKTEVAIRACVRAALDGKQVAFLCPTTILAEQHYQTIQHRTAMLPLRIGLLSRFVPKNQQKKIIKELANGTIDIVIGTHRLLSKDIDIPNLSLLVLDEEHRFGVRHKEQLKLLKASIDTLTLTATPIPRTLQLSISGIRELSLIETPPLERKPIETILCEAGDKRIQEALYKEIERGGQIFWVYNRVHGIEEKKRHVQQLCPQARIAIIHGQMNENALEESMYAFWHGEIDILLATTIIESGLDFPLANTIIIDSAHTFGLNQLYQLRGRVGRGERQGYAYLVIPHKKALSEIAVNRLEALLSRDYLGAGFQLAMDDLRIRGAGNILGEAQSGHIERIGIELYLELLEENVRALRERKKGEYSTSTCNVEMKSTLPMYIPEEYIPDPKERLYYYRKLALIKTEEEESDILAELKDRFGNIPEHMEIVLAIFALQRSLKRIGIAHASVTEKTVRIMWNEGQQSVEPATIMEWVHRNKEYLSIIPPSGVEFYIRERVAQGLRTCEHVMNALYNMSQHTT